MTETEDVGQGSEEVIKQPTRRKARSRSFYVISDEHKDVTMRVANLIRSFTFFENPLLSLDQLETLLSDYWRTAQKESGKILKRNNEISAYVSLLRRISHAVALKPDQLRSIHSRTRSQLVSECKIQIPEIYGLTKLEPEDLAQKVKWLLKNDRFICRADGREVC